MPSRVTKPPRTPADLLAWAKANPNKFFHARPANSGPGRAFVQGMPYLLGDKDPQDPLKGWDKTWAFLLELDQYVEYYPSGNPATMKSEERRVGKVCVRTCGSRLSQEHKKKKKK